MSVEGSKTSYETVGKIVSPAPGLAALVPGDAKIEKLADGFTWSEGPVWIRDGRYLLLSDVPANKMYRWSEDDGLTVFLEPSGFSGPDAKGFREPGSNGLIPGPGNSILVADHGNRAVAQLDLATKKKTFLATRFEGKRFNSPNDMVRASDGSIYFTDPPYGLEGINDSPLKELGWNGVYRLRPNGDVELLVKDMSFPNGIILSPDERTLYVANSDPERAVIMAFPLSEAGSIGEGRVFADLTALAKSGLPGLPDGMAIDKKGNLFATGPGGVHVYTPAGKELGRIDTGTAIANCAFGEDGRTLFLASNNFLGKIRLSTIGLGY
ncbi:SMP-30/gluconolactonase/LRE family protein [Allosphingosinicella deserti]|uniref:Gluconolactonase n=1 Tax=Allosphingosinicella deserti TaxID=2116704 RepID=A0A2P7QZA9_9SPHN|nr:SMP-30/gluconolactonase/LRE family protein [Sphingomonas deserti]PSJ43286.1 gluconolactonase [Sphingomonas deserti]